MLLSIDKKKMKKGDGSHKAQGPATQKIYSNIFFVHTVCGVEDRQDYMIFLCDSVLCKKLLWNFGYPRAEAVSSPESCGNLCKNNNEASVEVVDRKRVVKARAPRNTV